MGSLTNPAGNPPPPSSTQLRRQRWKSQTVVRKRTFVYCTQDTNKRTAQTSTTWANPSSESSAGDDQRCNSYGAMKKMESRSQLCWTPPSPSGSRLIDKCFRRMAFRICVHVAWFVRISLFFSPNSILLSELCVYFSCCTFNYLCIQTSISIINVAE